MTNFNNIYRVHLIRIDGQAIDTETGTLTHTHTYLKKNGKVHTPASIEKKFNKDFNWKGYKVDRIEVRSFNPHA